MEHNTYLSCARRTLLFGRFNNQIKLCCNIESISLQYFFLFAIHNIYCWMFCIIAAFIWPTNFMFVFFHFHINFVNKYHYHVKGIFIVCTCFACNPQQHLWMIVSSVVLQHPHLLPSSTCTRLNKIHPLNMCLWYAINVSRALP